MSSYTIGLLPPLIFDASSLPSQLPHCSSGMGAQCSHSFRPNNPVQNVPACHYCGKLCHFGSIWVSGLPSPHSLRWVVALGYWWASAGVGSPGAYSALPTAVSLFWQLHIIPYTQAHPKPQVLLSSSIHRPSCSCPKSMVSLVSALILSLP